MPEAFYIHWSISIIKITLTLPSIVRRATWRVQFVYSLWQTPLLKFYTSVPMLWLLYFIKLLMFDEQRNICCSYLLSTLIINIRLVTHKYLQNIHINGDVADNIPSVYSLQHSQVGKTRSEYNLFGISQTIKSTVPSVL